ncbi:Zinc finger BED domain-containing protein RICESLEEPER 3 [Euphorbia peplus]|nr:Zinc finger BED domain-containing protein RICESLEEPER 3 [Euphorbia peplus]
MRSVDEALQNLIHELSHKEDVEQSIAANQPVVIETIVALTPSPSEVPPKEIEKEKEMEKEKEDLVLGNKRALTSPAWNHFKRKKIGEKWKAICNCCSKALGGNPLHGTTHLNEHFKICPLRTTRDNKQHVLQTNKGGKLGVYGFDAEVSRKKLASMIILHEYPLRIVEHVGFQEFVASIQPMFKMVSRTTVKSDIVKLYEHEKEKTMRMLDKCNCRIDITTDM